MPGRGPAPNPDEHSLGHHDPGRPDAPEPTEVPAAGWLGEVPPMPAHPDPDGEWHPWTIEWYEGWRDVPWAAHFGRTDWRFIAETAIVYDRFVRGDMRVEPGLRLRTAKLGYTIEDRQRLRFKLKPDVKPASQEAPKAPGSVTPIDDRRRRMGL